MFVLPCSAVVLAAPQAFELQTVTEDINLCDVVTLPCMIRTVLAPLSGRVITYNVLVHTEVS